MIKTLTILFSIIFIYSTPSYALFGFGANKCKPQKYYSMAMEDFSEADILWLSRLSASDHQKCTVDQLYEYRQFLIRIQAPYEEITEMSFKTFQEEVRPEINHWMLSRFSDRQIFNTLKKFYNTLERQIKISERVRSAKRVAQIRAERGY